jgi:hypothetical protein
MCYVAVSTSEAAHAAPAGVPVRIGPTGSGKGLVVEHGGNAMRLKPIGIALIREENPDGLDNLRPGISQQISPR